MIHKCVNAMRPFDDFSVSPVVRQTLHHWGYVTAHFLYFLYHFLILLEFASHSYLIFGQVEFYRFFLVLGLISFSSNGASYMLNKADHDAYAAKVKKGAKTSFISS